MKERKVIPAAKFRILLRCLPFLLSFVLLFAPALSAKAASGPIATLTTPQLYCPNNQVVFPQNIWFASDFSLSSSKQYKIYLDFSYSYSTSTITNFGSNVSYWYDFAIEYNGMLHYPMFVQPGRIVFTFVVDGAETPEFNLYCYLNYLSDFDEVGDYRTFTLNVTPFTFEVIELPSESSVIGQLQQQNNLTVQQTNTLTNGFDSNTMSGAADNFASGSGELNSIEDTLGNSSSQLIDNYSDSAFDASFLDQIGSSLTYVATWFTNFWNIGGGLTATFTVSFAIFIAFYIIRVRS